MSGGFHAPPTDLTTGGYYGEIDYEHSFEAVLERLIGSGGNLETIAITPFQSYHHTPLRWLFCLRTLLSAGASLNPEQRNGLARHLCLLPPVPTPLSKT